jgi:hypothetical protein
MEYPLYVGAAVLGILFRYQLGLVEACRTIGVRISSAPTKTGYQDAITPPYSTKITLMTWALIIALFLYAIFGFGWREFGIVAGTFLVVSLIAGIAFVPKPESAHYLKLICRSMANRYADYMKEGDTVRADVMKGLIDRVGEIFGDKIV